MQLLDAHSDAMPEGDYLRACGLMKEVFDRVSRPVQGTAPVPQRRRGIPARIRTEAERQAEQAAHDRLVRDLFGEDVEYRPTSPARHPRRL
jgi:hypothetical protein